MSTMQVTIDLSSGSSITTGNPLPGLPDGPPLKH